MKQEIQEALRVSLLMLDMAKSNKKRREALYWSAQVTKYRTLLNSGSTKKETTVKRRAA